MPKKKTNQSAAKRFRKRTASGKYLRAQSNKSHNTAKRSKKRMRQLTGTVVTDESSSNHLKGLLPYL